MFKYEWEDLTEKDLDDLQAFAKNAVVTERKVVRGKITAMLNAGVTVPGIRLIGASSEKTQSAPAAEENQPGFIERMKKNAASDKG